jgi:hypothetical protein
VFTAGMSFHWAMILAAFDSTRSNRVLVLLLLRRSSQHSDVLLKRLVAASEICAT